MSYERIFVITSEDVGVSESCFLEQFREKFDSRMVKCRFIGYSENKKVIGSMMSRIKI